MDIYKEDIRDPEAVEFSTPASLLFQGKVSD